MPSSSRTKFRRAIRTIKSSMGHDVLKTKNKLKQAALNLLSKYDMDSSFDLLAEKIKKVYAIESDNLADNISSGILRELDGVVSSVLNKPLLESPTKFRLDPAIDKLIERFSELGLKIDRKRAEILIMDKAYDFYETQIDLATDRINRKVKEKWGDMFYFKNPEYLKKVAFEYGDFLRQIGVEVENREISEILDTMRGNPFKFLLDNFNTFSTDMPLISRYIQTNQHLHSLEFYLERNDRAGFINALKSYGEKNTTLGALYISERDIDENTVGKYHRIALRPDLHFRDDVENILTLVHEITHSVFEVNEKLYDSEFMASYLEVAFALHSGIATESEILAHYSSKANSRLMDYLELKIRQLHSMVGLDINGSINNYLGRMVAIREFKACRGNFEKYLNLVRSKVKNSKRYRKFTNDL